MEEGRGFIISAIELMAVGVEGSSFLPFIFRAAFLTTGVFISIFIATGHTHWRC